MNVTTGGCNCGEVRYEVTGSLRGVIACHCLTCRRQHGSYGMYSTASRANLIIIRDRGLTWYSSSSFARRGFCGTCGAGLFWERDDSSSIGIAAGTLDDQLLRVVGHVFVAEKPDLYELSDGLPQFESSSEGRLR